VNGGTRLLYEPPRERSLTLGIIERIAATIWPTSAETIAGRSAAVVCITAVLNGKPSVATAEEAEKIRLLAGSFSGGYRRPDPSVETAAAAPPEATP
jgi:hypothetical protein